MITKERLEELIEQGATIYIIKTESFIAGDVNKLKIVPITLNNCYGISTEKYNKKHNCRPQFYYSAFVFEDICDVDKVFETKEEAEWYLKFGKITRTETLSLPTWEEFVKLEENSDYGFTNIKIFDNVRFGYKYCPEKQTSALFVDRNGETLFYTLMVTKENYLEACELCRKLFLGEDGQ